MIYLIMFMVSDISSWSTLFSQFPHINGFNMGNLPKKKKKSTIFSHVVMGLPGLNQYKTADKVSCSRTQHSESAGSETPTTVATQSNALPSEPSCSTHGTI